MVPRAVSRISPTRPHGKKVVLGDARISLGGKRRGASHHFHVLAVDAFSSDSIPVHLLTREAFQLYLGRLDEASGVLAST